MCAQWLMHVRQLVKLRGIRQATAMAGLLLVPLSIANAQIGTSPGVSGPHVHEPVKPRESEPFTKKSLERSREWQPGDAIHRSDDVEKESKPSPRLERKDSKPPIKQPFSILARSASEPLQVVDSAEGIPSTGFVPPDVSLAVGPDHYIQMVNRSIAIFDRRRKRLLDRVDIHSLWKDMGGLCGTADEGDPITRYDHLADRWLISQFRLEAYTQCIAISKGPDPVNDGWFMYAFPMEDGIGPGAPQVRADAPKIGVWPDGYYMGTQRNYVQQDVDVWVFEREKMLTGSLARHIHFAVSAQPHLLLLPSDLNGPVPPKDTPNVFARHVDADLWGGREHRLELWEFSTNWNETAVTTFTPLPAIKTEPFNSVLCNDKTLLARCIDQKGTNEKLEHLSAWLMPRLQYRKFATYETLVANHTIDVGGHAGIRWYELRKERAWPVWTIYRWGTHSPDNDHRWMGSIAMDAFGNIALGYSVSGTGMYPSIRVATRTPKDPPSILSKETTLVFGGGSQTDPGTATQTGGRWGDYTSMELDPVVPCTFLYANEFYAMTSTIGWKTQVSTIHLPRCSNGNALALYRPGTGTIWLLERDGITGAFKPVYQQGDPGSGIGGYDLASSNDRAFAFDYQSRGLADHLTLYRPGTGTIWILERDAAGNFSPVYKQGDPGNGIGGYDLASPDDRVFAYDYGSSGKLDHLVLYRPGSGTIWILAKDINGNFVPVHKSNNGIGGYDLASPNDQAFAFDFDSSGRLDHLVLYRPGTGAIFILRRDSGGNFSPVFQQGDPGSGIGGYDLASANDRAFAYDFDNSGKLDHIALYRPGTGTIWILKKNALDKFTPVVSEGDPGSGIGGYDLHSTNDVVFALGLP